MFHAQITLLILQERLEKQLKVQESQKNLLLCYYVKLFFL